MVMSFIVIWPFFQDPVDSFLKDRSPVYLTVQIASGVGVLLGLLALLGFPSLPLPSSFYKTPLAVQAKLEKMKDSELRNVTGQNLLNLTVEQGTLVDQGAYDTGRDVDCGWYCSHDIITEYSIDNRDITFARLNLNAKISMDPQDFDGDGGDETPVFLDTVRVGHYNDDGYFSAGENAGYITETCRDNDDDMTCDSGENQKSPYNGASYYHWWDGNGPCQQANFFSGPNCPSVNSWASSSNTFDIGTNNIAFGVNPDLWGEPHIEGAYVEFAFEDGNKLAGFRVGANKIKGGANLDIPGPQGLSGTLRAQEIDWGVNIAGAAHRNQCFGHYLSFCKLSLASNLGFGITSSIEDSPYGDQDGWTEDFWISFQRKDIFWEYNNPAEGTFDQSEYLSHTDGKGFWLHATDDVAGRSDL